MREPLVLYYTALVCYNVWSLLPGNVMISVLEQRPSNPNLDITFIIGELTAVCQSLSIERVWIV
jgi:hypothetical protein